MPKLFVAVFMTAFALAQGPARAQAQPAKPAASAPSAAASAAKPADAKPAAAKPAASAPKKEKKGGC